jgi:hypothetical protein
MLGKYCFYECESIAAVTFESGSQLSSIAESAFWGCSSLSSIFIPSSVEMLGAYCFSQCNSLSMVTFESGSQLSSIADFAFACCSSLSSICIPPGLQRLGKGAFNGGNLREISVSEGNRHFKVCGSFLCGFECISVTRYFGSEVTVRIANTIERLDAGCFYGNESISNVIFESGSTLLSIAESAFCFCSSLSSIFIPSSVESLGKECFSGCESLSTVTFESDSKLSSIAKCAFHFCLSLSSIFIPSSLQNILADYQALLKLPATSLREPNRVLGGADSVEDEDETVSRVKNE